MATAPVWSERRLLAIALRAMMAVAVLAALVLSWRYAAGPADPEGPPSVRVVKLLPGTFLWADAPADAWRDFVCLETANAGEDVIELAPGQRHALQQTLRVSPLS